MGVISKALRLIEEPANWLAEELAQDKDGKNVDAWDPKAVTFCAIAALTKASGYTPYDADSAQAYQDLQAAFVLLESELPEFYHVQNFEEPWKNAWDNIIAFNLTNPHEDVIAAFRRAAERELE